MAHLFQSEHIGKKITAHVYKISGELIWLVKEYAQGIQVKETQFDSAEDAEKYAKSFTNEKKKSKLVEDSADE
jgi:hypothetical protein